MITFLDLDLRPRLWIWSRVVSSNWVQEVGCDILQVAKGYWDWLMYVLGKWRVEGDLLEGLWLGHKYITGFNFVLINKIGWNWTEELDGISYSLIYLFNKYELNASFIGGRVTWD